MRSHRSYLSRHSLVCTYVQRTSLKRHLGVYTSQKHEARLGCVQAFRIYATYGRESDKSEAPIGVYTHKEAEFQLHLLQRRLGDSFKHLSRHINVYFKRKGMTVTGGVGQPGIVPAVQDVIVGLQKQEHRTHGTTILKDTDVRVTEQVHSNESRASSGLQLFHMSSLVSRFGESYNNVASHINHVFSKNPTNQEATPVSAREDLFKRSGTRSIKNNHQRSISKGNDSLETGPARHEAAFLEIDSSDCRTLEEGYLHFARHINRYFGAKVTDTVKEPLHQNMTIDTHQLPSPVPQRPQNSHPGLRPKSLFHLSALSTHFGENYAYMATHINRYFKDSSEAEEEEMERDPYRGQPDYIVGMNKHVSFVQHFLNASAIPSLVGRYLGRTSTNPTSGRAAPEAMLDKVVRWL